MKFLTINTHSIIEKDYDKKCEYFVDAISRIKPDIITMQEVNQSKWAKTVDSDNFCGDFKLKTDNHAMKMSKMLKDYGLDYYYNWLGIKYGYKIFEEGLGVLSLNPIEKSDSLLLTKSDNINSWKTRKAQIIKTSDLIICNVHMGWWDDEDEPFSYQFKQLNNKLSEMNEHIFLMGDFNSPADKKNQGYEKVVSDGWFDTYTLADDKDEGFTVISKIDGWKNNKEKRIDYIFTNRKISVKSSKVIFDGKNEKIISDHFGVIIEI